MAPVKQGRELPAKESAMFKAILKFYEHKQYRKGLKQADQILKKFAEHGETQAMKGLFLSHLERKDEGYEFVKRGLRNDLTSHTCWHVYGLMHRADKNYEEAIKCYVNALKFDKTNMQIIRDLSLLQIQMRNVEGFNETRHQLLSLRPTNRMYWVGLAISYHLLQKYDTALDVLAAFEESLKEQPDVADYENSEMLMYKNLIIEESGDIQKALDHLEEIRGRVVDKRSWREAKARLFLKAEKPTAAEVEYRALVDLNPDSHQYLDGLLQARGLAGTLTDATQKEKAGRLLTELGKKYPRSHVIKRTPLKYVDEDAFRQQVDDYLRPMFRKGVPSLFVSLKDLYANTKKAAIIEDLVLSYKASLEATGRFSKESADGEAKEPPTAYLWVLYFLAQHYDRKRETNRALELINAALKHTPTMVELLMTKARIYKHAGDPQTAADIMNEARELDLQDRFINSKCTKYLLRASRLSKAEATICLFTKTDSVDPLADLVDMQCMWFALESAKLHLRNSDPGRALLRLHQIDGHFNDVYDDQFDFHSYCLRKMTLRAYLELLRCEDTLRRHPFYVEAARMAVETYIQLFDKPTKSVAQTDADKQTEADRKKADRKARKAALKSAAPAPTPSPTTTTTAATPTTKPPADTTGQKYIDPSTDYLASATKFLLPLLQLDPSSLETQILGAKVYTRKHKFLLALQSLKKAVKLDAHHPSVIRAAVEFLTAVKTHRDSIPAVVQQLLDSEVEALFPGATSPDTYLSHIRSSLKTDTSDRTISQLVVMADLDPSARSSVLPLLKTDMGLETAILVHSKLKTWGMAHEEFLGVCKGRFAFAEYFRA
ncbi:NMDA receptor-regulated protein 1-domain-containing protein [Phlyctochytrium arcticum]|nr:NMDA receptor-regulated protein 1-domain-containing protein [Phlyctochytrium arcticum]